MHWKAFPLLLLACALILPAHASTLELTCAEKQVGTYEKVEFTLSGIAAYANPYDPDTIDVRLEITGPDAHHYIVPAFYAQDYERRQQERLGRPCEWLYPLGKPDWRARFAPPAAGSYTCVASVRDYRGITRSQPINFICVPSTRKGYVRVSSQDPRYLAFSDGTPFFPIGQNLAFVTDSYTTIKAFQKIAANGGNFARVWSCCGDWAMALEAPKSGWSKSWEWNPPVVLMPGGESYLTDRKCLRIDGKGAASLSFNPTRPLALRLNTRYALLGKVRTEDGASLALEVNGNHLGEAITAPGKWVGFKREFTTPADCWWLGSLTLNREGQGAAWLADLSLKEADGDVELLEEADVNRPVMGEYNQADCYQLDQLVDAAGASGIYLQLCVLTRDLYMGQLNNPDSSAYERATRQAAYLLRYAVARWGYSPSIAVWEYFNEMDPGLPLGRFYAELGQYLDQVDPYHHLRASSAWASAPHYWKQSALDTADLHYYLRPAEGTLWKDEVGAVLAKAKLVRESATAKPALFSEFGMTEDNWQHTPYQEKDRDYVHLHNGLWASALSGMSGAVLSWFWEDIERYDGYKQYQPLAAYLADVPFTSAKLHPADANLSQPNCRAICLFR